MMRLTLGEEDGLTTELKYTKNDKERVTIDFSSTKAMRIAEEGITLLVFLRMKK
jgi:hypothetical protein